MSTSVMNSTNSFMSAMNAGPKLTTGEKGSDSYTRAGVGDDRVAFLAKLVRGLDPQTRLDFVNSIVRRGRTLLDAGKTEGFDCLVDLFVILFETRDIQEGKGERDLFYGLVMDMFQHFPEEVLSMLPMVPQTFGSWLDFNKLWILCGDKAEVMRLKTEIEVMYCRQLVEDNECTDNSKLSLAGKWAPREKSASTAMARVLALRLFPVALNPQSERDAYRRAVATSMKRYRQLIGGLNQRLKTVEVNMCDGTWANIKPGAVPAGNLTKHRKAFMNQVVKGPNKGQERCEAADRRLCAQHFKDFLEECKKNPAKAKMHGRNLHIHQIVRAYWDPSKGGRSVEPEDPVLEAQFADTKAKFEEMGTLTKTCVLLDTSGSMHSRSGYDYLTGKSHSLNVEPILPAASLAALITQVNHPAFRNAYIRFSDTAAWKNYGEGKSLRDIVSYMAHDGDWGGTTNFASAMNLILKTCVEHKVSDEDLPDLLVLSDMQFDAARGCGGGGYGYYRQPEKKKPSDFEAHYQTIQRSFLEAGYSRAPVIRFWNLAANTVDFPAQQDSKGVELYSGFSANMLKHFMEGTLDEFKEPEPPTPYDTMRKVLDDSRYDCVRLHLSGLKDGTFAGYHFTPVEDDEDDDDK